MVHVLIIEDEALIALDLQWLVQDIGATSTDVAATEAAAVSAAAAHRPDIITSDVTLRKGSGPDAVRAIEAAMGPVPVIYVTATPEVCADLARHERLLGKPINQAEFVRIFEELRASLA